MRTARTIAFLLLMSQPLMAQTAIDASQNPTLITRLAVLAALSLLPFAILLLTSFMKIVVVLSLLRSSIGLAQTPPNQVLNGIALLLTLYVMFPTGLAMYKEAESAIKTSPPTEVFSDQSALFVISVVDKAKEPLRNFLSRNCNSKHVQSIYTIAKRILPETYKPQLKQTDFMILIPSFVTTELQGAFTVGVLIFLPFFMIDMIVSNVLLAMGMMMLSPMSISLPIKLLLIVMTDAWTLLIQGLALSFK